MHHQTIYALDFDGVICDSSVETGITGWKAASHIWKDMPSAMPPDLVDHFRLIRPIIETGYEAILAMRLLYLGHSIESMFKGYHGKVNALLDDAQLTVADLKQLFGTTRDNWIAENLSDWIDMNPLFDGVAEKLQTLCQQHDWYVITTKQERFVKQILAANEILLADERIFGLDRNMSKVEVLRQLAKVHPAESIYFVEDRLPTLLTVLKHDDLSPVKLAFALWGYNTTEDKTSAKQQPFMSLALENFLAP